MEKFQKPQGLNWLINVSVAGFHHPFYKRREFLDHLRNLKTPLPDIRNCYKYLIWTFSLCTRKVFIAVFNRLG
jgi:hypothetical protein